MEPVVIYVDADACPVKEHIFRVAKRYSLKVIVVSNTAIFLPRADWILPVVVTKDFDAVDNWIESKVQPRDIVVTNDILLAARVLKKEARAIDPRGKIFTQDNIGESVATRELLSELRQRGELGLGPKKMGKKHSSHFLSALDELINSK